MLKSHIDFRPGSSDFLIYSGKMDYGKKDSPQRTQGGAEICCFSLRTSALSAVFRILPENNKKSPDPPSFKFELGTHFNLIEANTRTFSILNSEDGDLH